MYQRFSSEDAGRIHPEAGGFSFNAELLALVPLHPQHSQQHKSSSFAHITGQSSCLYFKSSLLSIYVPELESIMFECTAKEDLGNI